MDLLQILEDKRNEMGLTYRQAARKSGVSHTWFRYFLQGKKTPSVILAMKIVNGLGVEVDTNQVVDFLIRKDKGGDSIESPAPIGEMSNV